MKQLKVSVIIQTRNDDLWLDDLFGVLAEQEGVERPEMIVVDHGSRDDTLKIAQSCGVRILHAGEDDPRRSMGINNGAEAASGDILIFVTGRTLPLRTDWLASCLGHFSAPLVGGVFSPVMPHESSSMADHLYCWPFYAMARTRRARRVDSGSIAKFATANIAIRRRDWLCHPFAVGFSLERQMEDWIGWMLAKGHDFIEDHRFAVRYSFGLSLSCLKDRFLAHTYSKPPKPSSREHKISLDRKSSH